MRKLFSLDGTDGNPHEFEKVNGITEITHSGSRDWYKCIHCGIKGTRDSLEPYVNCSGPADLILNCSPRRRKELKAKSNVSDGVFKVVNNFKLSNDTIKIIHCAWNNPLASNLTDGSIHHVIINEGQPELKSRLSGVWVLAADDKTPVLLLNNEYELNK